MISHLMYIGLNSVSIRIQFNSFPFKGFSHWPLNLHSSKLNNFTLNVHLPQFGFNAEFKSVAWMCIRLIVMRYHTSHYNTQYTTYNWCFVRGYQHSKRQRIRSMWLPQWKTNNYRLDLLTPGSVACFSPLHFLFGFTWPLSIVFFQLLWHITTFQPFLVYPCYMYMYMYACYVQCHIQSPKINAHERLTNEITCTWIKKSIFLIIPDVIALWHEQRLLLF